MTDLPNTLKQEDWISRYDTETDSLSIAPRKVPDDARIHYFNSEIAMYITKDKKVKGIFVEYFTKNFMQHSVGLKTLAKEVRNTKDGAVITLSKEKLEKISHPLQEAIKQSMLGSIKFCAA